ncbi:hypothetical protein [Aestuariivirga sp.]|uniref:hypothetical protein n=1 Tax=Aestuariivirga sp. TaxID=2650926 RepID=UPI0025C4E893|nr:hypothetical protein [Aestuariivirga sp.]MCA3554974.1 hypothetical protein [Aestuariivirga sp.]
MKSLLMVTALLVGLSTSAQAEDATAAPPPPQAQTALAPAQDAAAPDGLPQSAPEPEEAMSAPLDANSPPSARGGGCGHDKSTVYLTN